MTGLLIAFAMLLILIAIGIRQSSKDPRPFDGLPYAEYKEYNYTRAWEKKNRVTEYIEASKRLQAIKKLQAQTGCSLADATAAVEQLEISVKRRSSSPVAFSFEAGGKQHIRQWGDERHYNCESKTPKTRLIDISFVDGMDGYEFEYFCAELLKKDGFSDVGVTSGSGDQGVDILATKGGVKYAIQCKNYASPLSNTPVQEVSAGKLFYGCHVGVVMTNSTFTSSAKALAQAIGVLLWDRTFLQKMMAD